MGPRRSRRAGPAPSTANAVIRQSCGPDGHLHVIPARVAAQLGPVLDPALFDVTTLIADGYDDAHVDALPVMMRFPAAKAAALPDTLVQRKALPGIGAVAGRLSRSKASFLAPGSAFVAGGGNAVDHFGHGTHVAATIAGSGAGAGGARRGVAPGARLLIGKVLDDQGGGEESQVIAGMEWAAARADVVNMSLGGGLR